jgi:predicted TIM-barrel fold metal-dependent hydrolase
VLNLETDFSYKGPIFDAHSHVVDKQAIDLYVNIGGTYGVEKSLLIMHGPSPEVYENLYPGRFVYAKYFYGWSLFSCDIYEVLPEIESLKDEGYSLAKTHFAPIWVDRMKESGILPSIDNECFDPFFDALSECDIPTLVHVSDPDTYYRIRYNNAEHYGTKEEHLKQFENRLARNPNLQFQVAHFCAQPEPHRLSNLARLFDTYHNFVVDTGSARWMCRELSKNPQQSREFLIKYADRILFGTDCVARPVNPDYYTGRHSSLRILLETDVLNLPLPFIDADTADTGGTFINGLRLPQDVLKKIYWENANQSYPT